jgi:hypothetical protein
MVTYGCIAIRFFIVLLLGSGSGVFLVSKRHVSGGIASGSCA